MYSNNPDERILEKAEKSTEFNSREISKTESTIIPN